MTVSASESLAQTWLKVGALDDIPRLGARVIKTTAGNIAIFRTQEDEVFALEDSCPHRGGPLSQGIVFGTRVACPLHDWVISLEEGCAVGPDEGCVKKFQVRCMNGEVYLSLDE